MLSAGFIAMRPLQGNGSTCLHYLAVPSGDEGRDEAIMALLLSNGALLRGDSVLNKVCSGDLVLDPWRVNGDACGCSASNSIVTNLRGLSPCFLRNLALP